MANGRLSSQELGYLEESISALQDDLGFIWFEKGITSVDVELLDEQLNELYWNIHNARKRLEAAQYLATTSFVKRGTGVKLDNVKKSAKAKEILRKAGIIADDKDIKIILDYYNKYFKDAYNAYAQFDEDAE